MNLEFVKPFLLLEDIRKKCKMDVISIRLRAGHWEAFILKKGWIKTSEVLKNNE